MILLLALASVFLGVVFAVSAGFARSTELLDKLQRYTAWRPPASEADQKAFSFKNLLAGLARFAPVKWRERVELDLLRAAVPLKGGEFLALQGLAALLLGLLGFIITGKVFGLFLFGVLGWLLPSLYLRQQTQKRYRRFDNQLADSLLILANSLRAGFSLFQAMHIVAQEMPDPIANEFRQTLREMSYGTSVEAAMQHLSERVGSSDLDLMVTAILIQRGIGGNLSEVLQNIHDTIEERLRIKREIRTLTAQGRLSGYMIASLPLVIGAILFLINPSYLMQLFSSPIGWGLVTGGIVSQLIGFLLIRRIVNIRI